MLCDTLLDTNMAEQSFEFSRYGFDIKTLFFLTIYNVPTKVPTNIFYLGLLRFL